jgi:hypothetical protein
MDITKEQLEEAYKQAQLGKESPSMAYIHCDICKEDFLITKGQQNTLCEHLTTELERARQLV